MNPGEENLGNRNDQLRATPTIDKVSALHGYLGDSFGNLDAVLAAGEGLLVGVIVGQNTYAQFVAVRVDYSPSICIALRSVVGR